MDSEAPSYMFWAKTHRRARFELTESGIPAAHIGDFDGQPATPDLQIRGSYGDPDLIRGIAELRGVAPESVLPVPGASAANFIALACIAAAGERVLVETPGYDPLVRVIAFLGLNCAYFRRAADRAYRPEFESVRQGLAEGAGALVLTNLHNPSGLICPRDELEELAALTSEHNAWMIVDEVYLDYARLNSGRPRVSAAGLGDHVIVTDSLTKVYGLGGLRAGWLIAQPHVVRRAAAIVDLLHVVNPVVSAQIALRGLAQFDRLERRCQEVHRAGYPVFASWLGGRTDLTGYGNDGAPFGWLRLPAGVRADELATLLATEYDTNIVPGTFFGCEDHVRIGFGLPADILSEGLSRVGAALDRLGR
ncbi:MAG: pyridoxal phosphate-dependent aminotransferase [Planctomycetota bacterium]